MPAAAGPVTADETTTPACEYDAYDPPSLDRPWSSSAAFGFESPGNWTAGRIAQIGATGDCSLVVTDDETATLPTAKLASDGVFTALVDFERNGSLRFAADNATVALTNDGPAYSTTLTLAAGGNETTLSAPDGRFVAVALLRNGTTARVAVWEAGQPFDGVWDARVEGLADADWRLTAHGRVALDGVALGSVDPAPPETPTPTPTEDQNDGPFGEEFPEAPGRDETPQQQDDDGTLVFFGLLLAGFGALNTRYAYEFAKFGEQMDAIGSKTRSSEVEPADWNVALSKIGGIVMVLIGLWLIWMGAF